MKLSICFSIWAVAILLSCQDPGSVNHPNTKEDGRWPLMIHQEIGVDTTARTLHSNDLLLKLEKVVNILATDGFIVDWDGQSDSFKIRSVTKQPLGGFLTLITPSDTIDFVLTANSPLQNEAYFSASPLVNQARIQGDTLIFSRVSPSVKCLFIWNNRAIQAHSITDSSISVLVPKEAADFQRSYVRIFSWDDSSWGHDLKVPFSGSTIIRNGNSLDRRDPEAQRMYFVLVDRFNNGDTGNDQPVKDDRLTEKTNFHGGDIKGITQQIKRGYFDSLKINAIWLSPITQNPMEAYREYPEPRRWYSGYHGYWPIRSGKVDHRFGSENDLKELIETAHDHGISILLDYVCNHVHEQHPVIRNHPEYATALDLPDGSKNIRLWDDQRLTTWFDDFLPTLDLSNPEVIQLQSDSALFWLQEYGIDGFRHDATKHIPEIFWQTLTRKIKDSIILSENRPVYQIGETYGKPDLISRYIDNGLLDAQFDFNLFFMVRDQLAKKEGNLDEVANTLRESLRYYGFSNSMGYISGNHDQPRFTAYASGALLFGENERLAGFERDVQIKDSVALNKMAQLIAFNNAIPGVPVIFYGDEIGLTGAGDPDNRRPMRFEGWTNKETELWRTIQKIQHVRSSEMALIYGDTEILLSSKTSLVLRRRYFDQEILFFLNSSDAPMEITLPKDQKEEWRQAIPLIGNASMLENVTKNLSIIVPPNSFDFVKK